MKTTDVEKEVSTTTMDLTRYEEKKSFNKLASKTVKNRVVALFENTIEK